MNGSGDSLGLQSIFIKENWTIEVDTSGGAKVNIVTSFTNGSNEEQRLTVPYEFIFKEEEKPNHFQRDDFPISGHAILLNEEIKPFQKKDIIIDVRYTNLAKAENDWRDISLNLRHGAISPHHLTIECFLPMEAEDIRFRTTESGTRRVWVDDYNKKAIITFTGPHTFLNLHID
ncbi:MAG: hypothetical protein H8D26_00900 [Methanomicrobia archaeon]|nr:hypothetical protein [Methanomicrobia archaeon]